MAEREGREPKSDIFVPPHLEQDYCRRNNIEYRSLNNGIKILGVSREVEDRSHASLDVRLPSGYISEPLDKPGLSHFVEHMMARGVGVRTRIKGVPFNAYTGPFDFGLDISEAIVNPGNREGVFWSVLPDVRQVFNNPLYGIEDVHGAIEQEKSIIMAEMVERETTTQLQKMISARIFAPQNPFRGKNKTHHAKSGKRKNRFTI